MGPLLRPAATNTATKMILSFARDGLEKVENNIVTVVIVRDVANALLMLYEKPEANGRYICAAYTEVGVEEQQGIGGGIVDSIEDLYEKGLLDRKTHLS
ncbi:hypothetical protein Sjap_009647 [Stephania japonica]|uniref:Uncharacterized protein n=1 Tax=Stephania japonica TaxID=461633 RepID=A0AAP0P5M5_9MAGN